MLRLKVNKDCLISYCVRYVFLSFYIWLPYIYICIHIYSVERVFDM